MTRRYDDDPPPPLNFFYRSTRFTWIIYFKVKMANFSETWQVCTPALCLELTFAHKALVLISTRIGDFTDFFLGHFLRQWNLTTVSSGSDGGSLWRLLRSLVHPKTQHLKILFGADIVYLQQLQQVFSNDEGGPHLLTQGCVCAYRVASQMGGTFSPQWREQRENLKQLR